MARIHSWGAELNSTTAGMEFDAVDTQVTISTTTVRSGTYSLKVAPTNVNCHGVSHQIASASGTGPYFFRTYFNIATLPNTASTIMYMHSASVAGSAFAVAPVASIQLGTGGVLTLFDSSASVSAASSALSTNTWYRVELKIDGSKISGSRIIEAKLNGTVFGSNTSSATAYSIDWIGAGANLGNSATASAGVWYLDDMCINDGTGSSQKDYPGSGKIVVAGVLGAGSGSINGTALRAFVPSSGSNANYTYLTDFTPPDDATSWLTRSNAAGAATNGDNYTVIDPVNTIGMSSGDNPTLVQVNIRGASGNNSSGSTKNLLGHLLSAASGTHSIVGASVAFNSASGTTPVWVTNGVSAPHLPLVTSYTDPETGSAWTVTGTNSLTNMQIGYETQSTAGGGTASAAADVTSVWATIEYTPGSVILSRNVTDTASASDSLSVQESLAPPVADSAPAIELLTRQLTFSRAITETVAAADTVVSQRGTLRSISDTASVGDAVTRGLVQSRAVSESTSTIDSGLIAGGAVHFVTDNALASDSSPAQHLTYSRIVGEAITLNDVLTQRLHLFMAVTDSAPATDLAGITQPEFRLGTVGGTWTSGGAFITTSPAFIRRLTDFAFGVDDVQLTNFFRARPVADAAPAVEAIAVTGGGLEGVIDFAHANDVVVRLPMSFIRLDLTDPLITSDSVVEVAFHPRPCHDSAPAVDTVDVTFEITINEGPVHATVIQIPGSYIEVFAGTPGPRGVHGLLEILLVAPGFFSTGTTLQPWFAPETLTISGQIRISVGVPSPASVDVNVRINGVVTFALSLPATERTMTLVFPDTVLPAGAEVTLDIVQAQTAADLLVQLPIAA